ncbi:cysteine proteinase [Lichtheimia hyalospora FSU 10163]|nr:cysteine proteinase [Lichtheimia hyalospora FSU 10163]
MSGDGNCLFRALSDQYHGSDKQHKQVRQQVCQYLRDNEEEYQFFVEDDQSFEHHVSCMERDGTYGGNMELAAFARLNGVDIKVYQPGLIYVINGTDNEEEERSTLHIAYHSWEHYSSVRNMDGPFSGPPEIKEATGEEHQEEQEDAIDSKEKVVMQSCPEVSLRRIRRLLRKHKGDPNKVIDVIFEEQTAQDVGEEQEEKPINQENNDSVTDKLNEPKNEEPKEHEESLNEPRKESTLAEQHDPSESTFKDTKKPKEKKLTRQEKKRMAKQRQKQNKIAKLQAAASTPSNLDSSFQDTDRVTSSMKQLYI